MGITINYRGRLKSIDLIEPFCCELKKIATLMKWPYTILDNDFKTPTDAHLEWNNLGCEIVGHLALKGISLKPNDCSSLSFLFDQNGFLRSSIDMITQESFNNENPPFLFIKTQFAPVDIHIALIKILRYLKRKYFQFFEVIDEGEYWETGDEELLKEKIAFLSQKIDAVSQAIENSHLKLEPGDSDLDILAVLDKILRDADLFSSFIPLFL